MDENAIVAKFNFLPSLDITFKPVKEVSIQGSYFKTLNRPGIQELSSFRHFDTELFLVKSGNPFLETSEITNYHASVNWVNNTGFSIAASGFYKQIDQPIEQIITQFAGSKGNFLSTPYNVTSAELLGLQATINYPIFKNPKSPLSHLSLFANGSWTNSIVKAGPIRSNAVPFVREHSLAGTPDLTFNGGLILQYPKWPQVSVLYSQTSDYLKAVGSGVIVSDISEETVTSIPDYRVKGRGQLNLQLSHRFFQSSLQVIAGAQNLLNSPYIIYQDLNGNQKFDSALVIDQSGSSGGKYISGIDNTVLFIQDQKSYYVRIAFTF